VRHSNQRRQPLLPMKRRSALLALFAGALCVLAACAPSANAPAPAPDAASAPAGPAAAAPEATTAAAEAKVASTAAAASADSGAGDSSLERMAALPATASLPAGKWVAGTNYRPLAPAQPTDAEPGKVEVVEMFWYACPHCYALDPYLESWRKSLPAYVEFRRVPVTWGEAHRAHARLFYTLQALGKEEALHAAVFNEIHENKNYLFTMGDERQTQAAQAAFATAHGIGAADFATAYGSFSVQTNLQKADDLVRRYRVDGVPTLIIGGKYVTDITMAGGKPSDLISLVNDLAMAARRR